jgi:hypothetical protein
VDEEEGREVAAGSVAGTRYGEWGVSWASELRETVGFAEPPARKQTQGSSKLVLEVSAGWTSSSTRGLWGVDALLHS